MSPEHSSALHDEIDRFCRAGDFQEALTRAGNLLRDDPLDRTARLYELLIKVVLDGPADHEAEVEQLRNHSDLTGLERGIVRKILMVCYDAAERQQDHGRMWGYQRLLRRLVLNQTLDFTIPRDEQAGSIKMPDEFPRRSGAKADVPPGSFDEGLVGGTAARLRRLFDVFADWTTGSRPALLILLLMLLAAVAAFITLRGASWESTTTTEKVQPPAAPAAAQPPAEVAVGELSAKINDVDIDALSAAKIREFFERKLPELKQRYQTRARDVSGLTGDLTVDLSIDGNGNVTKIYESGATLIDFGFKKLIVDEIQKWQLPALQRGTVALSVVIVFGAKASEATAAQFEAPAKTSAAAR